MVFGGNLQSTLALPKVSFPLIMTLMRSLRLLLAISCSLLSITSIGLTSLRAQQNTGSINGEVKEEGETPRGEYIDIIEVTTGTLLQQVEVANHKFVVHDIPFGTYLLRALIDTTEITHSTVVVNSTVPFDITLEPLKEYHAPKEVIVEATAVDESRIGPHTIFSAATIDRLPAISNAKKMEAVLLNTPGIIPDEDGRMHMRGEDAQLQYVIDGIPITTNQTRVYNSLFNADLIKSIDIQRGGLNPEYGVATSGVLTVTTKSGFDEPWFGHALQQWASFGTRETGLDFGGNFGGVVALYGAYSTSQSSRYLDPISGFDPIHDDANGSNYFGKLDFLLGKSIDLEVLGSYNKTRYAIPNTGFSYPVYTDPTILRVKDQDQRQDLDDYLAGAKLDYEINEATLGSVSFYHHHQHGTATSGGLMKLNNAIDDSVAIAQNEKFFIGGEHTIDVTGGQLELSNRADWAGTTHNLKFGVCGEVYPLKEFFTFAVTNPALSDTAQDGDRRFLPYDLTKGGSPFLVDQSKTGKRYSAYAQDMFTSGKWTVSGGLRFDMFDLFDQESGLSPRLGVTYAVSDAFRLRASYNRIIMQAPLENILVSSSSQAVLLTQQDTIATPPTVRSEKEHVFELGGSYRVNENLDFDLAGYGKLIDDFIVKTELGNSGIIFPVNLKQGLVVGGELQARLRGWNNLSGLLSVGTCVSKGIVPSDGSSPIAAGLILGEEGYFYGHPWSGEDMFNTEHNQLMTASFALTYDHPIGISATLGGRFDSGLPFDLADANGVGLSVDASRAELKRRGYSDDVIDLLDLNSEAPGSPDKSTAPHVTFDASVSLDLTKIGIAPLMVTGSIINILDTPYLYKFESSFGGTHFGQPRMFMLEIRTKS